MSDRQAAYHLKKQHGIDWNTALYIAGMRRGEAARLSGACLDGTYSFKDKPDAPKR